MKKRFFVTLMVCAIMFQIFAVSSIASERTDEMASVSEVVSEKGNVALDDNGIEPLALSVIATDTFSGKYDMASSIYIPRGKTAKKVLVKMRKASGGTSYAEGSARIKFNGYSFDVVAMEDETVTLPLAYQKTGPGGVAINIYVANPGNKDWSYEFIVYGE